MLGPKGESSRRRPLNGLKSEACMKIYWPSGLGFVSVFGQILKSCNGSLPSIEMYQETTVDDFVQKIRDHPGDLVYTYHDEFMEYARRLGLEFGWIGPPDQGGIQIIGTPPTSTQAQQSTPG